jgi:hypothetical protein
LNGRNLGIAFSTEFKTIPTDDDSVSHFLFPALSCNEGEIVEIRLLAKEMTYCPISAIPVGKILSVVTLDEKSKVSNDVDGKYESDSKKPIAVEAVLHNIQTETDTKVVESLIDVANVELPESAAFPVLAGILATEKVMDYPTPFDLTTFTSAKELESIGIERLKHELMAAGLKCGGTLTERAIRLFAIRGLDPNDYPIKLRAKGSKK